jgi:predicted phage terminase large subunit-like protein
MDDAIGRAAKDGWHGITRRALAEPDDDDGRHEGEPLAPEIGWTSDVILERMKLIGDYGTASLFQGRPRKRGGAIFRTPHFYAELPKKMQYGHGVDLAYTKKTRADRSVCITMGKFGDDYYIVDCVSKQVEAPEFTLSLVSAARKRPGRMLFIGSGTEKGSTQFIKRRVPRFEFKTTSSDKFVRAQEVAAAWNSGHILVPDPSVFPAPWLFDFLDVIENFTGINDARDDEVDALASVYRVMYRRHVSRKRSPGMKRRM